MTLSLLWVVAGSPVGTFLPHLGLLQCLFSDLFLVLRLGQAFSRLPVLFSPTEQMKMFLLFSTRFFTGSGLDMFSRPKCFCKTQRAQSYG